MGYGLKVLNSSGIEIPLSVKADTRRMLFGIRVDVSNFNLQLAEDVGLYYVLIGLGGGVAYHDYPGFGAYLHKYFLIDLEEFKYKTKTGKLVVYKNPLIMLNANFPFHSYEVVMSGKRLLKVLVGGGELRTKVLAERKSKGYQNSDKLMMTVFVSVEPERPNADVSNYGLATYDDYGNENKVTPEHYIPKPIEPPLRGVISSVPGFFTPNNGVTTDWPPVKYVGTLYPNSPSSLRTALTSSSPHGFAEIREGSYITYEKSVVTRFDMTGTNIPDSHRMYYHQIRMYHYDIIGSSPGIRMYATLKAEFPFLINYMQLPNLDVAALRSTEYLNLPVFNYTSQASHIFDVSSILATVDHDPEVFPTIY